MSGFQQVDITLLPWARAHGLHVTTLYRDDEVRSIAVVDAVGRECQLFLTEPTPRGDLRVIAVTGVTQLADVPTRTEELVSALDQAHRAIQDWFSQQSERASSKRGLTRS